MEVFAAIIGFLTVTIAVLVKVIGLPDQIRQNRKRRSTKGLSTPFFALGFLSYVLWTVHGFLQTDWVLVIGQGVGMITMGIIVLQVWKYRNSED